KALGKNRFYLFLNELFQSSELWKRLTHHKACAVIIEGMGYSSFALFHPEIARNLLENFSVEFPVTV
ncbi:MAG TPA: hypothetical protein VJ911_09175, partial [Cryomorphaceae bacterium]|nr:hypothetical protein [Cryomorphaceae bacterium]